MVFKTINHLSPNQGVWVRLLLPLQYFKIDNNMIQYTLENLQYNWNVFLYPYHYPFFLKVKIVNKNDIQEYEIQIINTLNHSDKKVVNGYMKKGDQLEYNKLMEKLKKLVIVN